MFRKLFGRKDENVPAPPASPPQDLRAALMAEAIAQVKADDPLVGPKIGARELNNWLLECAKSERGVHVETMLTMLGSLAGFSCQIAARHALLRGPGNWGTPWAMATGADGATYYFGDGINHFLLEDQYSFWSLAAGTVAGLGEEVPDVIPVVQHVTATIGTEDFGRIRYPQDTSADDLPVTYVRNLFPDVQANFERLGLDPGEWPIAFGLAAQEFLHMAKDVVAPPSARMILRVGAIAMAKVDPASLGIQAPIPGG